MLPPKHPLRQKICFANSREYFRILEYRPLHTMEKVVTKRKLRDSSHKDDLEYWLNRPTEERVSAVELLRRQFYGSSERLQRVSRIVERT